VFEVILYWLIDCYQVVLISRSAFI